MKIESIYDSAFRPYGKVLEGYDAAALISSMEAIPLPESGVAYEPSIAALEAIVNPLEKHQARRHQRRRKRRGKNGGSVLTKPKTFR